MIKSIHLLFILLSISSFLSRIFLAEFKPQLLQIKFIKIAPHVIDTLLILSGLTLVFQSNWLAGDYGWIISKFIVLVAYVGLGVAAMHSHGIRRWSFFTAALSCFGYIIYIAVSKHGFI